MFVYLFIFTALMSQALSHHVTGPENGCQAGWKRYLGGNSCLKALSVKLPFHEAQTMCLGAHSELVKIDSARKNIFVRGLIQGGVGFWIGVMDIFHHQVWTYIDGTPLTYEKWMGGTPKKWMWNQFCGIMSSGDTWKEEHCSKLYPFVCEKASVTTTVALTEVVTKPTPKCPGDWAIFQDGSCIKAALGIQLSYYDARSACQTVGGDLVKINSQAKNTFVRGLISDEKIWIGVVDKNHDETWTYIDGSRLSYASWMKGQPNNYKNKEACGNLYTKLLWKDLECEAKYSFVCEIPAGSPAVKNDAELEVDWVVNVYTSDIKWADTDDAVYIQLIGNRGNSRTIRLNGPGDDFERGRMDTFKITTRNIGTLRTITVTAAKGGDGWHLNKMALALEDDVKTGSWTQRVFECNCWIDGNDRKTTSVKTISATRTQMKTRWNVKVYTGDKKYAGTDDDVFIQVKAPNPISEPTELDTPSKDDFKRNSADTYKIVTDFSGTMPSSIVVWAGKGGDGWFLGKIELQKDTTFGLPDTYVFQCDCWFDADEPRDEPPVRYIPRTSTKSG